MKTPREILLNHHQVAEPWLDQIRRDVVADLRSEKTAGCETPLLIAVALKLWRELVLPARVAWAGIAAGWLMIGLMNLSVAENSQPLASAASVTPQELREARTQHRELLRELALLPAPEPAEPLKPSLQPRSQRRSESACA